ncbi:MAG TPA: hypothetical protein VIJ82_10240 [Streptosporangiaceae bacterium]
MRRALPAASLGRTLASRALAWAADRAFFAQPVQLADHAGVVLAQGSPPVSQDPQHRELLVIDGRAQPLHAGRGQRDRVRVGGIGLAALPCREQPRAGRQLGWHIHHMLTIGQKPVRDVPADALASLNRPHPLRPVPGLRQHRRIPGGVGGMPALASDGLIAGHDLDRGSALVRVHPDDYLAHLSPPCSTPAVAAGQREGTATSSRTNPS